MQEEGVLELGEFIEELKRGDYGSYKKDEVDEFLDEVKNIMLSNLYLKIEEKPEWRDILETRQDEIEEEIEKIKKSFR